MALAPLDFVLVVILAIALVRGVLRGLLRETFSIASLAAACLVVMLFYGNAAEWLLRVTQGRIGEISAPWIGGALLESFHVFGATLGSAANVTLMSYRDTCHIGVVTDSGAVVDPEVFRDCMARGFAEVMDAR